MSNRAEKMGELTREAYTRGPYSSEGNLHDFRDVPRLKKAGLVVKGVWLDVDTVVVWDANGSRSELTVEPMVIPGRKRAETAFVPVRTRRAR